jgi:hypothetical protein
MPTIGKIKYQEKVTTLLLTKLAPRAPGLRENFELATKNFDRPKHAFSSKSRVPHPTHIFLLAKVSMLIT